MIVSLELSTCEGKKPSLIYWDSWKGEDVICEVNEDGTLELDEYGEPNEFATSRTITLNEFIELVAAVYPE